MNDEYNKFFSAECYIERENKFINKFLSFYKEELKDLFTGKLPEYDINNLYILFPRQYGRSHFTSYLYYLAQKLELNHNDRYYSKELIQSVFDQYTYNELYGKLPTLEEFVDSLWITISPFTPEIPKVVLPHISNKLDFILENDEKPHEYLRKNNYKNGYQSTVNHTHKSSHIKM